MRKPQKWEPTDEAFKAYLTKDREHAKSNAALMLRSLGSSRDTLHLPATIHEAWQSLLESRT